MALNKVTIPTQSLKVRRVPLSSKARASRSDWYNVIAFEPPTFSALAAAPAVPIFDSPSESMPAWRLVKSAHATIPR